MRAAQVEEMIRHRGDKVVVVGLKKAFMPAANVPASRQALNTGAGEVPVKYL